MQQHIDGHFLIAEQLIAEELEFARGAAGDQQHLRAALHDLHDGLPLVIGDVAIAGRHIQPQRIHAAAGLGVGLHLELDRHQRAAGAQANVAIVFDAHFAARFFLPLRIGN